MAKPEPTPIELLCRNAPFDALPPALRAELGPVLRRVSLAPGEVLFAIGDPLAGFYLVETGALDIETGGSRSRGAAPAT